MNDKLISAIKSENIEQMRSELKQYSGTTANRIEAIKKIEAVSSQIKINLIAEVKQAFNCNKNKALALLINAMQINVSKNENIQRIEEQVNELQAVLMGEILLAEFPNINRYLGRRAMKTIALLEIFLQNIYTDEETGEQRVLMFYDVYTLAETVYDNRNRFADMSTFLSILSAIGAIKKLENKDIPMKLLSKFNANRLKKKITKRSNVFEILVDDNYLENIEAKCKEFKENNVRLTHFGKETLERTFNRDTANKVFVQDLESDFDEEIQMTIAKTAQKAIKKHGYILEKVLLERVSKKYSGYQAQKALNRGLQQLLDAYDLERATCSNELKERFDLKLKPNARPKIIYKNEE